MHIVWYVSRCATCQARTHCFDKFPVSGSGLATIQHQWLFIYFFVVYPERHWLHIDLIVFLSLCYWLGMYQCTTQCTTKRKKNCRSTHIISITTAILKNEHSTVTGVWFESCCCFETFSNKLLLWVLNSVLWNGEWRQAIN